MAAPGSDASDGQVPRFVDETNEDLVELNVLRSKPVCFLVIGKPGAGRTSLASRLAKTWGCIHVDGRSSVLQAITMETELGKQCADLLDSGQVVDTDLVLQVMRERLAGLEVSHHGYVLDDIPLASEQKLGFADQLGFINSLPMTPDVIINLKIKDEDITERRLGQKVDPDTGDVFIASVFTPKVRHEDSDDDEEEPQDAKAEDDEADDDDDDKDNDDEELVEEDPAAFVVTSLPEDVVARLVKREQDVPAAIESSLVQYHSLLVCGLEDMLAEHDQSKLIELDAGVMEKDVYKSLMSILATLNLPSAFLVKRLSRTGDGEDAENLADLEGEDPTAYDADEMLRLLAYTQVPGPGFRWLRSRWGRYCPVELSRGKLALGRIELSVSFLSRCYCLSSVEAFQEFRRNPRRYLLGAMPAAPCKIAVLGGPLSGKSTLCQRLSVHYGALVIDPQVLIGPHLKLLHSQKIEEARADSLENAIETVRMKILTSNTEGQDEEEREADANRVTGDHPDVQMIVSEAVAAAEQNPPEPTGEVYIELVEQKLAEMEACRREICPNMPYGGKWILDGFPTTREHWLALEERESPLSRPDMFIVLSDNSKSGTDLMDRWKALFPEDAREMDAAAAKASEAQDPEQENIQPPTKVEPPPLMKELIEKRSTYENNITPLVSLIKSSGIEPVELEISQRPAELTQAIIDMMEDQFKLSCTEMTQVDEEEEVEDAAVMHEAGKVESEETSEDAEGSSEGGDGDADGEEEEEDDDEPLESRKKWGDAHHYCPVALHRDNVLRPGNPEYACRYHACVYYLSDLESQQLFMKDPQAFLPSNSIAKPPPLRIAIIGPKASGKTLHGRALSAELGIFHIDFRALLQEQILTKLGAPVGRNIDDIPVEEVEAAELAAEAAVEDEYQVERKSVLEMEERARQDEEEEDEGEEKSNEDEKPEENGDDEPEKPPTSATTESRSESEPEPGSASGLKSGGTSGTVVDGDDVYNDDDGNPFETQEESEDADFDEFEESIRLHLAEDEPLTNDTVERLLKPFWYDERYRNAGFVLEGFPNTSEDVRILSELGILPDMVLAMIVEEDTVLKRMLPGRLGRWQEKMDRRLKRRADRKALRNKERKDDRDKSMARRRVEIRAMLVDRQELERKERAGRKAQMDEDDSEEGQDGEEGDDDDDEEDDEQPQEGDIDKELEEMLKEEFPEDEEDAEEEEEEEEDESLEDAQERIQTTITEAWDVDQERIGGALEMLSNTIVPHVEINSNSRPHVVRYLTKKALEKWCDCRQSLFTRAIPVDMASAHHMLKTGYKQASKLGRWCPVQLMEGSPILPIQNVGMSSKTFPVVVRHHIYFCSSLRARNLFTADPLKYLAQPGSPPCVPLKVAIVGPPKSGRTSVAQHFVEKFGCMRVSLGEALRWCLANLKHTNLGTKLQGHLDAGYPIPADLSILVLEAVLRSPLVQARGYVLDGFPLSMETVNLFREHKICPFLIIELQLDFADVKKRAKAVQNPFPEAEKDIRHDSEGAMELRNDGYKQDIDEMRSFYTDNHNNWVTVEGYRSRWAVRKTCYSLAEKSLRRVQTYLERHRQGQAARIAGLCVTPEEHNEYPKSGFEAHCPVSWADGELFDCGLVANIIEMTAEYAGRYYCMASEKHMQRFLDGPDRFTDSTGFPPAHLHARTCSGDAAAGEISRWSSSEHAGHCIVTYVDTGRASMVPGPIGVVRGNRDLLAEYNGKVYAFVDEECRTKFLRRPAYYAAVKMPRKMPAIKKPIGIAGLPNLGFFEQSLATSLSHAIADVALTKPKCPFLSTENSALLHIAFHLKAHNPNSSEFRRRHYQNKLQKFKEMCELTEKIAGIMPRDYVRPKDRPLGLTHMLKQFSGLKKAKPTAH